MTKKRAFISFDYDHDLSIKNMFVGQARNTNSPFEIVDLSIKEAIASNWKENARNRIKGCDVVIVLCGEYTHTALGVSAEIKIAQEEGIPYFLLRGYRTKICTKPTAAEPTDNIHSWSWDNLDSLINGKNLIRAKPAKPPSSKKPITNKSQTLKTIQNKAAPRKKSTRKTISKKPPARKTTVGQTKPRGNKTFADAIVSLLFGNK